MQTYRTGLQFPLLALLALEPRSGYDLARWFKEVASHYWSASHGQIYPALAGMEAEGLVSHTERVGGRGPARKVYALTESGRSALLEWAAEPAREAPRRDEQMVKALCFGLLPTETALAQLRGVRAQHAGQLAMFEQIERSLPDESTDNGLSRAARLGILLTLRRGIGYEAGYVAWCDEAMALIQAAGA